jgi:glycosyltransferase involved in cell wall biosynthesis
MDLHKIDFVSFKMDSFDKKSFTADSLAYSKNSMLFFYDFSKITLEYKPDYIKWFPKNIPFIFPKSSLLLKVFMPLWWLIYFFQFIFLITFVCIVYRPRVCWSENTWVSAVFGLAKKFGLVDQSVYCSADWLAGQKGKSFLSRLANDFLFVYTDYIAISNCDLLINYSLRCGQAREEYWGRRLANRKHDRFPPPIEIREQPVKGKTFYICFLGQVREDSGLQHLLPLLKELNETFGIKLKIIGPRFLFRSQIEKMIGEMSLENYVDLYSWLSIDELDNIMQDCFCGLNLLTADSYSTYIVPGKTIQYLQTLTPVLITSINSMDEITRKFELGKVVDLNLGNLRESILHLFENQDQYRYNIQEYGNLYPAKTVTEYLAMTQEEGQSNRVVENNPTVV